MSSAPRSSRSQPMRTYRLSTVGRHTTLILMAAAVLIGSFALYTLPGTLGIRYTQLATTFDAALRKGLGLGQLIPAGILIVMLIAAPLLLWSLLEEWSTSYTVADDGLTYRTLAGIVLHYPWTAVRSLKEGEDADAIAELVIAPEASPRIRNPLLRWLHRQAFGLNRVPIYPEVEAHDELLAEIVARAGLARDRTPVDQTQTESPAGLDTAL